MPAREIRFDFISSGDSASYRINRYGHPDHDKRVEIQSHIYPLCYPDGTRRYNYTPEDYDRYVVKVKDYLHFEYSASEGSMDLEYARAFNASIQENYDRAYAKYPDMDLGAPSFCKGTAHLVRTDASAADDWDNATYEWVLVDL